MLKMHNKIKSSNYENIDYIWFRRISVTAASLETIIKTTKYFIRTRASTGISRDTVSSVLHGKSRICTQRCREGWTSWRNGISDVGRRAENKFEHLKVARVKEVSGVSCGDEALKNILDTYGYLIGEERKLLSLASGAGDEATVALMSDYLKEQEKLVWMLVAYLTCDCKK